MAMKKAMYTKPTIPPVMQIIAGSISTLKRFTATALTKVPELAEEAVAAVDTSYVPRLGLLDGAEEHLIET